LNTAKGANTSSVPKLSKIKAPKKSLRVSLKRVMMLVYCKACKITYDGNAQCCMDMDHEWLDEPENTITKKDEKKDKEKPTYYNPPWNHKRQKISNK
tara:strand:- start:203 stop:493 length:291 start_codon:yes stop_codon:yes gene_type:complete